MKKELFLFATAATMLTACVNTEDYRDLNIQQDSVNDGSIGFAPFAENITKAENSSALYTESFLAHHNDFAVWGYKQRTNAEQVFGKTVSDGGTSTEGTTVTVTNNDGIKYTYSPLRFWDKTAAKYEFYAAAPVDLPNSEKWTFHQGDAIDNGYFTTTATLEAYNLQNHAAIAASAPFAAVDASAPAANNSLINNFKGTGEIDRLIAAECEVLQSRYALVAPQPVHLNFIHILSKLNISIKKSNTLSNNTVALTKLEVHNMPATGAFDEHLVSGATLANGTHERWNFTAQNTEAGPESSSIYDHSKKKTYVGLNSGTNTSSYTVSTDKAYILESLVIPQQIGFENLALDGQERAHADAVSATYFTTYETYVQGRPKEYPEMSQADFNTFRDKYFNESAGIYTVKTLEQYQAIDGNSGKNQTDFDTDLLPVVNHKAIPEIFACAKAENEAYAASPAAHSSEPYIEITYTINYGEGYGTEEFHAFYNLAAAFNGKSCNENISTMNAADKVFAFNEGWQNTLNITINPDAIEFTADVAEWADALNPEPEYEVK